MQPRDALLWLLLSSYAVAALQKQAPQQPHHTSKPLEAVDYQERWRASVADSLDNTPLSGQRGYRDTYTDDVAYDRSRSRSRSRSQQGRGTRTSNNNERALATYAPAGTHPAVRAPPASRSSATAGLTSRQPARSLQDWRVEDIVLLATVDGKLYARDRTTGASRWHLEVDRPMVETTYHRHNKSVDEHGFEVEDPIWIVEPSQDGSIYMYAPGAGLGMQKLGYTVKELADLAGYAGDGFAYTAEKRVYLYTLDAGTGNVLKMFSSAGSSVNDDRCRRVNPLDRLDGEQDECEVVGTLILGRTEYIIAVQDENTGEQISTIRYFEWGPNKRDQDLQRKYTTTMDKKYVYSRYDGSVVGLNMISDNIYHPVPANKPLYREKFSSPVVRVYDILRPSDDMSSDASLVILPQPVGPSLDDLKTLEDDSFESVYVNCTENGSWYALSETNYPAVTEGAQAAQCYTDDFFGIAALPMSKTNREKFMGVHQLSPVNPRPGTPMIGAPEYPGIEAPPEDGNETKDVMHNEASGWDLPSVKTLLVAMIVGLVGCGALYREKLGLIKPGSPAVPELVTTILETNAPEEQALPDTPRVREFEPAKETIFPHTDADQNVPEAAESAEDALIRTETAEDAEEDEAKDQKEGKKHKRGKRGGRKAKEKEQAAADAKAKRQASIVPQPVEVISVAASESPQVAGPLQINSLVINTDKVIGQGSCGTSVFEGSFEGRNVAVKRMLAQYYELASQEVSFLQQSDDHPNVVRYFCQQKDDHFLYIAVELCQASLYEVWEAEKAKTDERQQQLKDLRLVIQQDTPKALQQLAAGLYHLHNLRIIHRDIKPQNILVAYPKPGRSTGPRLVISDFGLGKNLPENVSTVNDPTMNAGTSGWKAPELISQPRDSDSKHSQSNTSHTNPSAGDSANGTPNGPSGGVKRAADIFSLGCLFFWVLTGGIHPYEDETGWQGLRELNIKRNHKRLGELAGWSDAYEPMQLITSMLEHRPEDRPTALQVLSHPFFWPAEKRLAFLCDCSDHFEREPRGVGEDGYRGDSYYLSLLEARAPEVIGGTDDRPSDFLAKLDRHFVDTLGKQRKYSGHRLLDLLRALRNKKNHYEDMPEEVKKRVGALPGGYLSYWTNRFPRLLMACYEIVGESGLGDGDRFRGYFGGGV